MQNDRQDRADGTIGELALRALYDAGHATPFSSLLILNLMQSSRASLDVYSFLRSVNFTMRLGKKNEAVISMKAQDLIDILSGDVLPSVQQLTAIARVANMDIAYYHALHDALSAQRKPVTLAAAGLPETLEEQSEIVAFGMVQRERLRRMAGASSSCEPRVA